MPQLTATSALLDRVLAENPFLATPTARRSKRLVEVGDGPFPGAYEIGVAATEDEAIEHFALRFEAYDSHGYFNPDYEFELPLDHDECDLRAALFSARSLVTGKIHGAARLVLDSEHGLPMDDYLDLGQVRERVAREGGHGVRLAEFSRLISHPTGQRSLNRELVRSVLRFAADHGIEWLVGAGRCDIAHYYERWGFVPAEPRQEVLLTELDIPLQMPMPLYLHYMHVSWIRWENI